MSLGLFVREGDGHAGALFQYPDTGAFLDKGSPTYLGGILEMARRAALRLLGKPHGGAEDGPAQNEAKTDGGEFFDALYADEERLEGFLRAMQGIQTGNFLAVPRAGRSVGHGDTVRLGGAERPLCARSPHNGIRTCGRSRSTSRPSTPIAKRTLAAMNVDERVTIGGGDFFVDELPRADVVVMGNILHDWDNDQKQTLIRKAYASLTRRRAIDRHRERHR